VVDGKHIEEERVESPAFQECGFITRGLFDWWADEVLFSDIRMTREMLQYDDPALVILDGCSCHGSESFDQACMELGVDLAVSGSTHQPPDPAIGSRDFCGAEDRGQEDQTVAGPPPGRLQNDWCMIRFLSGSAFSMGDQSSEVGILALDIPAIPFVTNILPKIFFLSLLVNMHE
jgi:hypothetical protein